MLLNISQAHNFFLEIWQVMFVLAPKRYKFDHSSQITGNCKPQKNKKISNKVEEEHPIGKWKYSSITTTRIRNFYTTGDGWRGSRENLETNGLMEI